MTDAFYAEIRMWGPNWAPLHWVLCNGQNLIVSDYEAVFSLISNTYGGDGRTTFGAPDFRGRAPMASGTGNSLSPRPIGQRAGVETVTLDISEIPSHTHYLQASDDTPTISTFQGNVFSKTPMYEDTEGALATAVMPTGTIAANAGGLPHPNMMPYQTISFMMCMLGLYPQRP